MTDRETDFGPRRAFLLGLMLFVATTSVSLAQSDPGAPVAEPVATADAAPEVKPVPPSEIGSRATEVIARSRELVRAAAPDAVLEQIADELPDQIATIDEYRNAAVNQDLENAPPKVLGELRQQWLKYEGTLSSWSEDLDSRSRDVQTIRDELAHLHDIWRLTAEDSTTAELPQAIQEQIRSVRLNLQQADEEISTRRESVLTLQNQVSEQLIAIGATLEHLNDARALRQNDLFRPSMPPIWTPIRDKDGSLALGRDLADTWSRVAAGVSEFTTDYRQTVLTHLGLFVLLTGLMWLLSRRAEADEGEEDDPGLTAARAVVRRPVAASGLLITLTLSPLYSDAPVVIHSLVPIIALPFAAWLAPAFVPLERRRLVYSVLLLTFLLNIQNLIVSIGLLRQLSLLMIPVLGLVGLLVFQRRVRREDPVVWPGTSRVALTFGSLAFVGIFATALLGYVPLGELLANATIESSYLAFILLAGYRIVDALVLLGLRTHLARRLRVVQQHTTAIRTSITGFVRLVAWALWFWMLLQRLLVREAVVHTVTTWLTAVWQVGSLTISLGAIILFVLVLWLTLFFAKIVRNLLESDILPRAAMHRGRSHMVSMLVNYSIVGIGFLAALAAAGIRVEQFALIGGALGVGIGFGLQNVVSNFVSGLILVFERPIQVGDTVEVGALIGTVRRIGIRSSTLRTFDEAEVIVPNSDLISSHVVNWTLSDQLRRMEVKVGVEYGTDPGRVQAILVGVAKAHTKVLDYPAPYSLFKGFDDSSLAFVVRFWTSDFGNWIFIASEVTVGIDTALKEAGITIPFPQRDLHIYSVDPPAPIPDGGRPVERAAPDAESKVRPPQVDGDV